MVKYYEDLEVGTEFRSPGRTITETDITLFAALSGDWDVVHTDEEYCKKHSIYGTRIAHGLLGLAIVEGLKKRIPYFADVDNIASLGWTWNFTGPLLIGDTIALKVKIDRKRETKKPDRGIVYEAVSIVNQREEVIQQGEHVLMVRRRPPE